MGALDNYISTLNDMVDFDPKFGPVQSLERSVERKEAGDVDDVKALLTMYQDALDVAADIANTAQTRIEELEDERDRLEDQVTKLQDAVQALDTERDRLEDLWTEAQAKLDLGHQ